MTEGLFSSSFFLQEYDLSQLRRGLDDHPEVFCTEVFPAAQNRPCYRLQLQANEEIGKFLDDASDVKFLYIRPTCVGCLQEYLWYIHVCICYCTFLSAITLQCFLGSPAEPACCRQ